MNYVKVFLEEKRQLPMLVVLRLYYGDAMSFVFDLGITEPFFLSSMVKDSLLSFRCLKLL